MLRQADLGYHPLYRIAKVPFLSMPLSARF